MSLDCNPKPMLPEDRERWMRRLVGDELTDVIEGVSISSIVGKWSTEEAREIAKERRDPWQVTRP